MYDETISNYYVLLIAITKRQNSKGITSGNGNLPR